MLNLPLVKSSPYQASCPGLPQFQAYKSQPKQPCVGRKDHPPSLIWPQPHHSTVAVKKKFQLDALNLSSIFRLSNQQNKQTKLFFAHFRSEFCFAAFFTKKVITFFSLFLSGVGGSSFVSALPAVSRKHEQRKRTLKLVVQRNSSSSFELK